MNDLLFSEMCTDLNLVRHDELERVLTGYFAVGAKNEDVIELADSTGYLVFFLDNPSDVVDLAVVAPILDRHNWHRFLSHANDQPIVFVGYDIEAFIGIMRAEIDEMSDDLHERETMAAPNKSKSMLN